MWRRRIVVILLFVVVLIAVRSIGDAENVPTADPNAMALMPLTLYEVEPKNFLIFTTNPRGKVGTVEKDQKFTILETKEVPTLFEESLWLKVEIGGPVTVTGWVYAGDAEGSKTFSTVKEN